MTMPPQPFYILDFNYEGLPPELENWLSLVPALSDEEDGRWVENPSCPAPRQSIVFSSAYEPFDALDYAMNDAGWPLLSKRAQQLAQELDGQNVLKMIPATVINGLYQGQEDERFAGNYDAKQFTTQTLASPNRVNADYHIVQAPVLTGKFDWENSEYQQLSAGGRPMLVTKYVLKDLPEPLPPLFRISEKPGYLFISHALREVWKKHGIFGAAFKSPIEANWGSELDVMVPLTQNLSA